MFGDRDQREAGYSAHALHFNWAHIEELIELNESASGEAGKRVREALEHEYSTLPSGIICTCRPDQLAADSAGAGGARPSGRTPNLALADMKRAYWSLPIASLARTRLYLMQQPTHSALIRHPKGEACAAAWSGESLFSGELGHLVLHTETQIAEMRSGEFDARHRRRVALEGFRQSRSRVQDAWPALSDAYAAYAYMADFLNQGEAEFLEAAAWARPQQRPRLVRTFLGLPERKVVQLVDVGRLGAALDHIVGRRLNGHVA